MFEKEFSITLDAYQIRTGNKRFHYKDFAKILSQMLRKVHLQGEHLTDAMLLRGMSQAIHFPQQERMKWQMGVISLAFVAIFYFILNIQ
ncbi:MAG: hypothetical protein JXR88_08900 [Clostridia bacterium]|nr:hypothetical protein [Clostridia bacterium]